MIVEYIQKYLNNGYVTTKIKLSTFKAVDLLEFLDEGRGEI